MTSAEKVEKARQILNSTPSEEDLFIAIGLIKEAVEENDAEALYVMARLFYEGRGMEKDFNKSFELAQKALEAGCEKAKVQLAIYYVVGNVVEKNIPLGEQYLRDRIAEDDSSAYFIMGDFVFQNAFPDIEWSTFADYFKKSIELGEKEAMVRLAEKYNILCETEQAEYWYQQAAEAGALDVEASRAQFTEENYQERRDNILNFYANTGRYDKAIALVDRDVANGDEWARWMQAAHYAKGLGEEAYGRDVPKALAVYEQLADEGESHANFVLGLLYYTIEEIKDLKKSQDYMQKAADADNPDALFALATNYLKDPQIGAAPQYDFNLEKDETHGMELLQKAVAADSAQALFSMAMCYSYGKYLKQNDEKAFKLLGQSVVEGATNEKVKMLADMYKEGKGVEQNYEKAAELYQWATDRGDYIAAFELSKLYKEGKGVEQNDEKAAMLKQHSDDLYVWQKYGIIPQSALEAEAKNGNPSAMVQLGNRYNEGDGVKLDQQKAVEWWKKAAENGEVTANHNLGVYYYEQDDMPNARKYLETAISANYLDSYFTLAFCYLRHADEEEGNVQKGLDLLETAAKKGHVESQWHLACVYHDGTYGTKDSDKTRYWLEKCLEADHPKAHYVMAQSLLIGDLYDKDPEKALEHLRKAVEGGCHEADSAYIDARWCGNGAEVNREEVISIYKNLADNNDAVAMYWMYTFYIDCNYEGQDNGVAAGYLRRSANAGYAVAMREMGIQYFADGLFPTNHQKAFDYFEEAAKRGDSNAVAWLGHCYERGMGTKRDIPKAMEMYTQSAENREEYAIIRLVDLYMGGIEGYVEPDLDKVFKYLKKGIDENIPVCYLQAGLLLTDTNIIKGDKELLQKGIDYLKIIRDTDGEDLENLRIKAQERLAEIERAQESVWGKIKKGLGSIFNND